MRVLFECLCSPWSHLLLPERSASEIHSLNPSLSHIAGAVAYYELALKGMKDWKEPVTKGELRGFSQQCHK